jgi:hypothetical protein
MRRAVSVAAPFGFGARIGGVGWAVIRRRTKLPRLGAGLGVARRWDRVDLRIR